MPAGLARRLGGYVIDCAALFAGLLVLQGILFPINPILSLLRSGAPASSGQLHLWVFATITVPFLLYFALMTSTGRQATLGMYVLGMRVEGVDGRRVGFPRALIRSAVLLAPFEINHTLMFHFAPAPDAAPSAWFWVAMAVVWISIGLFLVSVLVSSRGQSVHDRVAGTVVISPAR